MCRQPYTTIVLEFFSNFNIDNIRKVNCRSESRLHPSSHTTQIFLSTVKAERFIL